MYLTIRPILIKIQVWHLACYEEVRLIKGSILLKLATFADVHETSSSSPPKSIFIFNFTLDLDVSFGWSAKLTFVAENLLSTK